MSAQNSSIRLEGSFTRPANTTAYSSGQLVANSTAKASVVPILFSNAITPQGSAVQILRARLILGKSSLTNASFKLHIFESLPVPGVGDGGTFDNAGALNITSGTHGYVGSFAFTLNISGTDGASGRALPDVGTILTAAPNQGSSIYGLLEATAAYAPASADYIRVILEGVQI